MAQTVTVPEGVLVIPGAYSRATVVSPPQGFGTTGVVAVVGESTDGPDYTQETLGTNIFTPDQTAEIRAKYGSGPLVDALLAAAVPLDDDDIAGAPQLLVPVKTNAPTAASGKLVASSATWGTLTAPGGRAGNQITFDVDDAVAEIPPTSGAILICPPQVSTVAAFRVNGGAEVTATLSVGELPSAVAAAINALAGVDAAGGVNRNVITAVAGTVSLTVDSGFQAHFGISATWANAPAVGDLLYVPTGSTFQTANEGSWVVTAATSNRIDAYKLLDAAGAGAARTPPITEAGLSVAATTDVQAFSAIVVSSTPGAAIAGIGKTVEIAESGSAALSAVVFAFAGAAASPPAAAWPLISTAARPAALISTAERGVEVVVARRSDSVSDSVTTGGDVVMLLGYLGTTASVTITGTALTTTVVGGAGAALALNLADYPTTADLCAYIATQQGYTAAPATSAMGTTSPLRLDEGVFACATSHGAAICRIKSDASDASDALSAGLSLVQLSVVAKIGLPDSGALTYLSGGARGATSNADVQGALVALERVRVNFVVSAIDDDAANDVSRGDTDAGSTYDIASIAAQLKTHCITTSSFKRRRNRQGFVGFRGAFAAAQEFAGSLASSDVAVCFQPVRALDSTGNLRTLGPKIQAAMAAGGQAAAGYQNLTDKFLNVSGLLAVPDFDTGDDGDVEAAIEAGLMFAVDDDAGGFRWEVDQTSYSKDGNFVYNSVGNLYNLNVLQAGFRQRMQRGFNGKSFADVSAAQALTAAERYLNDSRQARLLAPSDKFGDAGYGNLKVRITAPAIYFSATVILATGTLFEIIDLQVEPAVSTAG